MSFCPFGISAASSQGHLVAHPIWDSRAETHLSHENPLWRREERCAHNLEESSPRSTRFHLADMQHACPAPALPSGGSASSTILLSLQDGGTHRASVLGQSLCSSLLLSGATAQPGETGVPDGLGSAESLVLLASLNGFLLLNVFYYFTSYHRLGSSGFYHP